jgi:spore coat polysaccharide biosynthesis protein SpsF
MTTIAIIQARTGSTRLPGKVMYPLDGTPVLAHVVERVTAAETVDRTVVATSTLEQDDVVAAEAIERGVTVSRGSESDVLGRMHAAAADAGADIVVRICADNPLLSPRYIDAIVEEITSGETEYVANNIHRTVPVGLDVEAVTMDSFTTVAETATDTRDREHVTRYYRAGNGEFETVDVPSRNVFSTDRLCNRTDLRLTLDRSPDYELLRTVYRNVSANDEGLIPLRTAVKYIDENALAGINDHLKQAGDDG